ncbi:MAG: type I pullulanase [Saprospiraceae bacterium]
MKRTGYFFIFGVFHLIVLHTMRASHPDYSTFPLYPGKDLGLTYSPDSSVFRLWSPSAASMRLLLYAEGEGGEPLSIVSMQRDHYGVWKTSLRGDLAGRFYAFQARHEEKWSLEVPDPYAKAVGVNGMRAAVLDLAQTGPANWQRDQRPPLARYNDIVLYEAHIRDLTAHPSAGSSFPGEYRGLAERSTVSPKGLLTGLEHIRDLGVTHVHLLPAFDFRSIDERLPQGKRPYNWGYDPQNYNVPEGSYSSNPYDPAARIREFKEMVQSMHRAGLRVVMDVVYNHTGFTETSLFNQLAPGYYYRQNAEGGFSNASACGNEIASERPMARKFIVESVVYWAKEYHIDGFRFDLMGIHDLETMREIRKALDTVDPTIFIYGEGWTAGASPLPDSLRALKQNTARLDRIAAFGDEFRDGLRGHVFTPTDSGFVSGKPGLKESVKFGIVGAVAHPQVDYSKVNYSKAPWASEPAQSICYVSCHDNHDLWDRLALSAGQYRESLRARMQRLALTMVLTSQGVPFLHAGSEMMRTKKGVENSFESPDSINLIDWDWKYRSIETADFVKALIEMRKTHPAFRIPQAQTIREHLRFIDHPDENVLVYKLDGAALGDSWRHIMVIFNGSPFDQGVALPPVNWTIAVNVDAAHPEGLGTFKAYNLLVPAFSAVVMFSQDDLPE